MSFLRGGSWSDSLSGTLLGLDHHLERPALVIAR
jgi:hypothetical protein